MDALPSPSQALSGFSAEFTAAETTTDWKTSADGSGGGGGVVQINRCAPPDKPAPLCKSWDPLGSSEWTGGSDSTETFPT